LKSDTKEVLAAIFGHRDIDDIANDGFIERSRAQRLAFLAAEHQTAEASSDDVADFGESADVSLEQAVSDLRDVFHTRLGGLAVHAVRMLKRKAIQQARAGRSD